jgi:Skp family chaperone for outer membrane proteins
MRDTYKQEMADLHASYTRRMETTRNRKDDELAETKEALQSLMAQLESINKTKGQAEAAVQAAAVEKATLRGERERLQDKYY